MRDAFGLVTVISKNALGSARSGIGATVRLRQRKRRLIYWSIWIR